MHLVRLENLPQNFSESALKSMVDHFEATGNIQRRLVPIGNVLNAHVEFEIVEDAVKARDRWDNLSIDGCNITATLSDVRRKVSEPQGTPAANAVAGVPSSGVRYPFAPMNIGWLVEYVNSLKNPEKSLTMCRLMECLMFNAVTTSDPFMEHAVVHFYTKFSCTAWGKAQSQLGSDAAGDAEGASCHSFELCRQVFEVIGLIRRYPSANGQSQVMLLTLVDRVLDEIRNVKITSKSPEVINAIPEIMNNIRGCIVRLREKQGGARAAAGGATGEGAATGDDGQGGPKGGAAAAEQRSSEADSEQAAAAAQARRQGESALQSMTSLLKLLFMCLSSRREFSPLLPDLPNVAPCSEYCPCFAALKGRYPVYLGDVEKVKVIDSLVVTAGRDGDDDVASIARHLLEHYGTEFCQRALAHAHNGRFAIMRLRVFEALRLVRRVYEMRQEELPAKTFDITEMALLLVHDECVGERALRTLLTLTTNALSVLAGLRTAGLVRFVDGGAVRQPNADATGGAPLSVGNLEFPLTQVFNALCNQNLLLCVHGGVLPGAFAASSSAARRAACAGAVRCANPDCSVPPGELLKCSACRATFYCSPACQRTDWKQHRQMCREAQATAKARDKKEMQAGPALATTPLESDARWPPPGRTLMRLDGIMRPGSVRSI